MKALRFIAVPYIYANKVKWLQTVPYQEVRAKRKTFIKNLIT